MTKEKATEKYYALIERCKVEDVDCEKYNKHHINPLFTLKEFYNADRTKEFRYSEKDNHELVKCSIKHHIELHYYLCFMFDRQSQEFKDAKSAFWFIIGKYIKVEKLTENQLEELALFQEEIHKSNQTKEEKKEWIKNYKNSEKRKARISYLNSRLCYDPRFDIGGFNYFIGRYVSYGTLYSWVKWEKEQKT